VTDDRHIDDPPAASSSITAAEPTRAIDTIDFVREFAAQVGHWHDAGRWHGRIGANAAADELPGQHMLSDPPRTIRLGDSASDWDRLPAPLHRVLPVELPGEISPARSRLRELGVSLDPGEIDVYALGALLCRSLTGEPPATFARSPKVRQLVPEGLRSIIDRALQPGSGSGYTTAGDFAAALEGIRIPHSRQDTTPSFVSSANNADDTSSGRPRSSAVPDSRRQSTDSDAPLPFLKLGHYEIVARLGRGGMGDVYLAYERALDRQVAIKVLPSDLARSDEFVRRFKDEAAAAAKLIHPNIIQIHFIGEDGGQHYFVMQYVAGESLASLLAQRGKLGVEETLAIVEQALSGLAAAHERGMVHRDIKPGNILLDARHHRALLADFGLVKLLESSVTGKTATGVVMGTVDYISPEQGRGQAVDVRSDLYSIGVLLYQMLSGRLPFQADSPTALVFQHVYETAPRLAEIAPQVPERLVKIVERLLAKSPADRHQSAAELLADLRAVRVSGRAALPSDAPAYRPTTIVRLPAVDDVLVPSVDKSPVTFEPRGWWERAGVWALSVFRRHAPDALLALQNTQQQVDGAVAEYERRERELQQVAHDARSVLEELRRQAAVERSAGESALKRAHSAKSTVAEAAAQAEMRQRAADATELDRQIEAQAEQLAAIELRLTQVRTRGQELRNRRDILKARLKAAGARARLHGSRPRRRLTRSSGVVLAVVACIAALVFLGDRIRERWGADPSDLSASKRAQNANYQEIEQQPATNERPLSPRPGLFSGLKGEINFAAFVPVSTATFGFGFATANADGSVGLYQIRSNGVIEPSRPLSGHLKPVNSLAFSPDATRLAAASDDGTVSVWDVWQHRELRRLAGHTNAVTVVAFSGDGSQVLSAGLDGFARLWDVQSETEIKQIKLNQLRGWPATLAWATDGDRVLIGARLHGGESASLLSLEKKSEQVILAGAESPVVSAAFTRGGTQLVGVVGAAIRSLDVWDASTGKRLTTLATGFGAAAFTPDGSRALIENRKTNALEVWDISRGELSGTFQHEHKAPVVLAISPDGKKGLSTGMEGTLQIWELPAIPNPEHQLKLFQAESPVESVAFSPDGHLGVSGDNAKVHCWYLESSTQGYTYDIQNPVTAVAFSPSNDRILYATGQTNSTANFAGLRIHDSSSAGRFSDWQRDQRRFEMPAKRYTAAVFFDAGRQIATASADGTIRTWEVQTEKNLESADVKVPVNSLAVLGDGSQVLLGVNDNDLLVWDWKQKQEVGRLRGHTYYVYSVAASGSGRVAGSGGGDRTVRVWNVETREPIVVLTGHSARVNSVAVSAYGKLILSGSDDGSVRLWKTDAPEAALVLEGHVGPVRGVALSPDATRALSGGADGTVRLWDLTSALDPGNPSR
jgi:WD40 repeat protein/serine/threonine protein kinase